MQDPWVQGSGWKKGQIAPQKCYLDHIEAWCVNECTINWNASLAWVAGFLAEENGGIVVGETGRVTCMNMRANTIVVEGTVRGNITAEKLEIRSTGRVWGDVSVISFSTEDGAFLRGQVRMEEKVVIEQQTDNMMPNPQQQNPNSQPGLNFYPR